MNKIVNALSPEAIKVIRESYPVVYKRTPLWFYIDEIRKKEKEQPNHKYSSTPVRLKKPQILKLWTQLKPESKRKYFSLAEFDEVRYKEQKSLWMAEVGLLLAKHGGRVDKLAEAVPSLERLNENLQETLEKYKKNYQIMVQTETTKWLYKDVIEKVEKLDTDLTAKDVLSGVPDDQRIVLTRPRKPLSPFLLFVEKNRSKLMESRKMLEDKAPLMTIASREWSKLAEEDRKIYYDKYSVHLAHYYEEMAKFKMKNTDFEDGLLEQALREKKLFKRSLRRRLHEFVSVPISIRNAFNFFVSEHSASGLGLKELTKLWRELPENDKLKYKQMCNEDTERYYKDKAKYEEFMTKFTSELFSKLKVR